MNKSFAIVLFSSNCCIHFNWFFIILSFNCSALESTENATISKPLSLLSLYISFKTGNCFMQGTQSENQKSTKVYFFFAINAYKLSLPSKNNLGKLTPFMSCKSCSNALTSACEVLVSFNLLEKIYTMSNTFLFWSLFLRSW